MLERAFALILLCVPALAGDEWRCWQPPNRAAHQAYEKQLVAAVDAASLRNFHSVLAGASLANCLVGGAKPL